MSFPQKGLRKTYVKTGGAKPTEKKISSTLYRKSYVAFRTFVGMNPTIKSRPMGWERHTSKFAALKQHD